MTFSIGAIPLSAASKIVCETPRPAASVRTPSSQTLKGWAACTGALASTTMPTPANRILNPARKRLGTNASMKTELHIRLLSHASLKPARFDKTLLISKYWEAF
jgi:hypothetical protein